MTAIIDFDAKKDIEEEIDRIEKKYGAKDICSCGKKKNKVAKTCVDCFHKKQLGRKHIMKTPDYRIPMKSDPNYKMLEKIGNHHLHHQIIRLYGCLGCDWKSTPLCRFGFKKGTPHALKKNMHVNGICTDRKAFLLTFNSKHGRNSYEEWQTRYNRFRAQTVNDQDRQKFEEYQNLLNEKEDEGLPEKSLAVLRQKKQQAHDDYIAMWEKLQKSYERKLERELTAKITKETRLSLSDIHAIMRNSPRERVIDAEFEEEGDTDDGTEEGLQKGTSHSS